MKKMAIRILIGDVLTRLRDLPDNSVHCVVTSPPYWGLRSYLPDSHPDKAKEIGCEPTLAEHLDVMVNQVFAEIWRVLRTDGTCWVNYGDCYATSPNGRRADEVKRLGKDDRTFRDKPFSTIGPIYVQDYEKTDRSGATANKGHQAAAHGGRVVAGGYLKPKDLCMVPNRFAIAMQDFGWWVRSEIVWHKPNPMPESIHDRPATAHEKVFLFTKSERYFYDAVAVRTEAKSERVLSSWEERKKTEPMRRGDPSVSGHITHTDSLSSIVGANLKNVWTIPTKPFKEAHFATFPPALARPCIMAGTSEKGCCPNCGTGWRRNEMTWSPNCGCARLSPVPATVLDPFGGAGTTGLVAAELNRSAVLIELNEASVEIARRRIEPVLGQGSLLYGWSALEVA